jgi:hypothetical protein
MWYVYIIRSAAFPEQDYIGATADLKRRMADHNAGSLPIRPNSFLGIWFGIPHFPINTELWNSKNT